LGSLYGPKAIAPALQLQHNQEQEVLNNLNERLAYYVKKVMEEEERNKILKSDLDYLTQTWGAATRATIQKYDPELEKTRKYADNLGEDVNRARVRAQRLDYEVHKFHRKYEIESNGSAEELEKIRNLEHIQSQSIFELDMINKSIGEKSIEIKEVYAHNSKLNDQLEVLLNKFDEESYKVLELENENQTLGEHIKFLSEVYEKEIIEMNRLFDNPRIDATQFYRLELKRAIDEIRNDFRELNEIEKRELEAWYKVKSEEIRILAEKHVSSELLPNISLTNRGLKETIDINHKELITLDSQQKDLERRLRELEDKQEKQRIETMLILEKQDSDIFDKKNMYQTYLNDYDHLLHNKDVIEFEINIYKRILDARCGKEEKKPVSINKDELFLRLEREKAKFHDPHISIAWSNVNDLDLHVIEPSGEEISFSHRKSATGGELDVDMNAGSQRSQEPCENICWPTGAAPTGHYKVLVVYYSNHSAKDPTNYFLFARMLGKEFEFQGRISYGDKPHVYEFDI
jgi:chromosome segregation ATPase